MFNFKKYWLVVCIFLLTIILLLYIDIFDVLSSEFHISVQVWGTALTTVLTILFSFWLINIQKQDEKKKKILDICLSNKIFTLIHSNENYTIFSKSSDPKLVIGVDEVSNLELSSFITLIQIISASGLVNEKLKNECQKFLAFKKKYLNITYFNKTGYLFPLLELDFIDEKVYIISKEYYAFWDENYKFASVPSKEIVEELSKKYDLSSTIENIKNLNLYTFSNMISFDLYGNPIINPTDAITGAPGLIAYSNYNTTTRIFCEMSEQNIAKNIDVSCLDFTDKMHFPEEFTFCLVYTSSLKKLCRDIISEFL